MKYILVIITVIIACWIIWSALGRNPEWNGSDSFIELTQQIGSDSVCSKNIVAIQPYMVSGDYLSENHFYQKMKTYFDKAKQEEYFHERTVVLLPEYIGTWLVVNGEKSSVAEASSIQQAMTTLVLSNPFGVLQSSFKSQGESDRMAASIFRMKSPSMAAVYGNVFKQLAQEYKVTIAAGSIVLPDPFVENNEIKVNTEGPLYNTGFVFTSDGTIIPSMVKKSFPITSELPFVKPYPIEELPVFDLPAGKTTVLVCADSWYPESYTAINELQPEIILVNSYCSITNAMRSPWKGYDGVETPDDVDRQDVGKITEREAWIKYALPERIKQTSATVGVNVFLRGALWDLGEDGQPLIVLNGALVNTEPSERAGIWNICF